MDTVLETKVNNTQSRMVKKLLSVTVFIFNLVAQKQYSLFTEQLRIQNLTKCEQNFMKHQNININY